MPRSDIIWIIKGESGDNPDFWSMSHFAGGDNGLPFSDRLWELMDREAEAIGRNFVDRQKRWPLESPSS